MEEEANLTAFTLDCRQPESYWMGALGDEAGLFRYGERPPFYNHGHHAKWVRNIFMRHNG